MRLRLLAGPLLVLLTMGAAADTVVCDERSWPDVAFCYDPTALIPDCSGTSDDRNYYLDNDRCQILCLASVHLYEETNGYEGLQRQDAGWDAKAGGWGVDDTCDGKILPDRLHVSHTSFP